MVCSDSFRSDNPRNAVRLLKRRMELIRASFSRRPQGSRSAGDAWRSTRLFAEGVTARILAARRSKVVRGGVLSLDRRSDPGMRRRGDRAARRSLAAS
jgi:folate-dependent tRNA-U54 methylase TrmFO/GidA